MRLFLIALAVIYVVMVSFVETVGLGPNTGSAPGFGEASRNVSAHSLAVTPPFENAAARAVSSHPCSAAQADGQPAAAGCAETPPRGR